MSKHINNNLIGINILFILFGLFFGAADGVHSQDLVSLEKRFSDQVNFVNRQKQIIDSLQIILTERAKLIDTEKKKALPNNDKIIELMSKSATLTNQINNLQIKLKKDENELESTKKQLSLIYSELIDSLKLIQKSANLSRSHDLNNQILFLTEKKLLVSPRVSNLSFNPEYIIRIDLNTISDPTQRKIHSEYLENALDEVNEQIQQVTIRSDELKQIVQLQKKVERFVEEADFEGSVKFFNYRSGTNRNALAGFIPIDKTEMDYVLLSQFSSYSSMLDQLNMPGYINIKSKWGEGKTTKLSLGEYASLLKELRNYLQEYRLVLNSKLQSAK